MQNHHLVSRVPWVTIFIKAEIEGEKLDVQGLGSFTIDWHLGGDLKTIKCMLGCTQGANTAHPCPWCMRVLKNHPTRNARVRTMVKMNAQRWGIVRGNRMVVSLYHLCWLLLLGIYETRIGTSSFLFLLKMITFVVKGSKKCMKTHRGMPKQHYKEIRVVERPLYCYYL